MIDPDRRRLLATVGSVAVASGCVNLEPADHPQVPSVDVDVSFEPRDGVDAARLRVVDVDGTVRAGQVRVRVGDQTAYADGAFRGPYTYSERFGDEWSDGLQDGDVLWLSTGEGIPSDRRLVVQVTSADVDDWVAVHRTRTP